MMAGNGAAAASLHARTLSIDLPEGIAPMSDRAHSSLRFFARPGAAHREGFVCAERGDLLGRFFVIDPRRHGLLCAGAARAAAVFPGQAAAFVVCGLLFYRAVLFTHEMVHMRDKTFRVFRILWNLLVGIPFLMPTFMYYTHVDHHMRKHFSTDADGEYLALATRSPWHILIYLCQRW